MTTARTLMNAVFESVCHTNKKKQQHTTRHTRSVLGQTFCDAGSGDAMRVIPRDQRERIKKRVSLPVALSEAVCARFARLRKNKLPAPTSRRHAATRGCFPPRPFTIKHPGPKRHRLSVSRIVTAFTVSACPRS
ncbi:hypothetical protein F2P81_018385 [Scophthalmus maximus]|uniref:Uncharacterized protein n=1 Tax=Scophthalmus maximus TaxID=52904 RepID=A0A6A4SC25_SCOMX|nr:hypothetical protein F2P81_018385 [Scophthalmus maximus]